MMDDSFNEVVHFGSFFSCINDTHDCMKFESIRNGHSCLRCFRKTISYYIEMVEDGERNKHVFLFSITVDSTKRKL